MASRRKRYTEDFLRPFKRFPEIYQEHVDQSLGLMGVGEGETGLGSKALGLLGFGISPISAGFQAFRDEPVRDVLIGQGVDPKKAEDIAYWSGMAMDVATPVGAAKIGATVPQALQRAMNPNLGNLALTQDITRKSKAHKIADPKEGWYSGGKLYQLTKGAGRAVSDYTQMAFSPQKAYIFQKYGISPGNQKDLQRMMDLLERNNRGEILKKVDHRGMPTKETVDVKTVRNEFHSNLAYIDSILRKYLPDDARRAAFEKDMFGHLFPKQTYTTFDQMVGGDSSAIRRILDVPDQLTDKALFDHVVPDISKYARDRGSIALNSKPWQEPPGVTIGRNFGGKTGKKRVNAEGEPNVGYTLNSFLQIWRNMDGKLTKKNITDAANKHNKKVIEDHGGLTPEKYFDKRYKELYEERYKSGNIKRGQVKGFLKRDGAKAREMAEAETRAFYNKLYDIDSLKLAIREEGGYISVGDASLSADRLFATQSNRLVFKQGSNEGVWFVIDQMKQGSGFKPLEWFLETGSKHNFIAMDMTPITKSMVDDQLKVTSARGTGKWGTKAVEETQVSIPTQKYGKEAAKIRDAEMSASLGRKIGDVAPSEFVRRRLLQQAGQVGRGVGVSGLIGAGFERHEGRRRRLGAY